MRELLAARLKRHAFMVSLGFAFAATAVRLDAQAVDSSYARVWSLDAGAGVLVQPAPGGGAGPAIAIVGSRKISRRPISLVFSLAGAQVSDVGAPAAGLEIDRDWRIAAAGIQVHTVSAGRANISLGAQGGVLWARDEQRSGGAATPATWETRAGLLLNGETDYPIGRAFALVLRAELVQHVFTDDLIGHSGALITLSLGRAF